MLSYLFYRWGDTKHAKDTRGQAQHNIFDSSELCPQAISTMVSMILMDLDSGSDTMV